MRLESNTDFSDEARVHYGFFRMRLESRIWIFQNEARIPNIDVGTLQ